MTYRTVALRLAVVGVALTTRARADESIPGAVAPSAVAAPAVAAPADVPFRLLSTGVTVGVGLAFQWGSALYTSRARQDAVATTFMPYLHLAPWAWVDRPRARLCAASVAPLGDCLLHRFGVVVGKPLEYETQTTVPSDVAAEGHRSVRPVVMLGVGYTPFAAVSFVTGWTIARVTRADQQDVGIGAVTIAVGVNADVFHGGL